MLAWQVLAILGTALSLLTGVLSASATAALLTASDVAAAPALSGGAC